MIIYNVTVLIDETVQEEWLSWMKNIHIPEVMETGCFTEYRFCKILAETEGGISYSIQYTSKNMETLDKYNAEFAPALQEKHNAKYAGKFGAFRTLLEEVN